MAEVATLPQYQNTIVIPIQEKPKLLKVKWENIPNYFKKFPDFFLWRFILDNGKWEKTPITKWSYPENRHTFDDIKKIWDTLPDKDEIGLGFSFNENNDIVGMEADKCFFGDTPQTKTYMKSIGELLKELNSYTEVSNSTDGLHMIARVKDKSILPEAVIHLNFPGCDHLEYYKTGRWFAFTGYYHTEFPNDIPLIDDNKIKNIFGDKLPKQPVKVPDVITEGGRNNTLFRIASSLRAKGLTEPAILAALREENKLRCQPPLPDSDIVILSQQAGKYDVGDLDIGDHTFSKIYPKMKELLDSGLSLHASTESYKGKKAIEKYKLAVKYNRTSDLKRDQINLVSFNKKRTNLTEEQIKIAIEEANKEYDLLQLENQEWIKQQNKAKFEYFESKKKQKLENINNNVKKADLPDYISPIIHEKTGAIIGYTIDDIKYSNYLSDLFGIVYFNENIYIYDENDHVYYRDTNQVDTHIRNTTIKYEIKGSLKGRLTELHAHLTSMGGYTDYPFNYSQDTFPVLNGIIKIDKSKILNRSNLKDCITLLPHGKEHKFTYKINVNYNPDASTKKIEEILTMWVNEPQAVTLLIQAPAQALLQMQSRDVYKRTYLLQGDPNSGKSSYFKLLLKLFNEDFVGEASLQELCESKYVGGDLEGKIINICDDLKAIKLKSCENFKKITGDSSIGVERKFDRKYRGFVTAAMLFSCNYPPALDIEVKKDSAFWDRIEYIKFPNYFKVNPNFYPETYTDEFLSGFFNLILEVMIKIYVNGDLIERTDVTEVMTNWTIDSNPIGRFIEDIFVDATSPLDYSKKKLFKVYQEWFKNTKADEKRMITSENAFTRVLVPYGFDIASKKLKLDHGKSEHVRVYRVKKSLIDSKNIDLKPEPETLQTMI